MRRIKLMTSLMTVATIGLILVLFSSSVQAAGTINRPIEQWEGAEIIGWADPVSGLIIHPHAIEWSLDGFPFNFIYWDSLPIFDCESYHGFIKEKALGDETTLITIYVTVKGVPFMIFSDETGILYPYSPPLYYGLMQYSLELRIQFNTVSLYNILDLSGKIPSLFSIFGAAIPGVWPYPEEPLPLVEFMHIVGNGYLTEGGEGNLHLNQLGIWNPEILDYDWPAEQVTIS